MQLKDTKETKKKSDI